MESSASIPPFEFATASRIMFGWGCLAQLGKLASALGRRALLVTGRDPKRSQRSADLLLKSGLQVCGFSIPTEPSTTLVEEGVGFARSHKCDIVIAVGGGSAIDGAKAIAAMLANPGELGDYLEVVGAGRPLPRPSLPFIAVPTTAGTGSEVTRNAVLLAPKHHVKVSLRSPYMLPAIAIVDPELTCELPPSVTATTGLDALTQVIEPFVCNRPNPLTDAVCLEGIRLSSRWLKTAVKEGSNRPAREAMSMAALCGGIALANAGLGAVHGFAGPIGGMFTAPHGAICAALLPAVMNANLNALPRSASPDTLKERYRTIARIVTNRPDAEPKDAVQWVSDLVRDLGIPGLSAYGLTRDHAAAILPKAVSASSMKANSVTLIHEELSTILLASL